MCADGVRFDVLHSMLRARCSCVLLLQSLQTQIGQPCIPAEPATHRHVWHLHSADRNKLCIAFESVLCLCRRAHALSIQRMLEEDMYFGVLYSVWQVEEQWAAMRPVIAANAQLPAPLRGPIISFVRSNTKKQLHLQVCLSMCL